MSRRAEEFYCDKANGTFWYQVFGDKRIQVFKNNQNIGELCIHSDQICPPTDHVINMKVLVELDEQTLWKEANWYGKGNSVFAGQIAGALTVNSPARMTLHESFKRSFDANNSLAGTGIVYNSDGELAMYA